MSRNAEVDMGEFSLGEDLLGFMVSHCLLDLSVLSNPLSSFCLDQS